MTGQPTAGARLALRSLIAVVILAAGSAACGPDDPRGRADALIADAREAMAEEESSTAVIQLKNAVQAAPDYAAARLALGELYLRLSQLDNAEKELRRARDLGAPDSEVAAPLLRTLNLQGAHPDALGVIETLSGTIAENPDIRALHADALIGQGRRQDARALLGSAEDTDDARLLARHAQLAALENDTAEAKRLAGRATGAEPASVQAHMIEGLLHATSGSLDDARTSFRRAHEIDPYSMQAGVRYAQILLADNALDEANAVLTDLTRRLGDRVPFIQLRSMIALGQRDYDSAKTLSERILGVAPDFGGALFVAGLSNSNIGNHEIAVSQLNKLGPVEELPAIAVRALAYSNMRLGRPQAALNALERSQSASDDMDQLRLSVAAAVQTGDADRARELLQAAVEANPGETGPAASLATLQLASGDLESAREVLAGLPNDAVAGASPLDKARLAMLQLQAGNAEQALALANDLKNDPDGATAGHTLAGLAQIRLDRTEAAIAELEQALALSPGNRVAALALATQHQRAGDVERAESVLRNALDAAEDDSALLGRLVQMLAQQARGGEAEALLRGMVEERPDDATARTLLARLLLVTGKAAEALDVANQAVEMAPDSGAALETLGRAQEAVGDSEDAVATFARLRELRPESGDAGFLLARAQTLAGNRRAARETLREVIAQDPGNYPARIVLARLLLIEREAEAAEEQISTLTQVLPDSGEVVELQAGLAQIRGEDERVAELRGRLYEIEPTLPRATSLARALWATEQQDEAVSVLRTALADADAGDGGLSAARWLLGEYLYAADRPAEAVDALTPLVEANPDNALYRNQLAYMLWKAGRAADAVPHAERAHELEPKSPEIADTLGIALLDSGETARALDMLETAARALPEQGEVQYHYARALAAAGRDAEAREVLTGLLAAEAFARRAEAQALLDRLESR